MARPLLVIGGGRVDIVVVRPLRSNRVAIRLPSRDIAILWADHCPIENSASRGTNASPSEYAQFPRGPCARTATSILVRRAESVSSSPGRTASRGTGSSGRTAACQRGQCNGGCCFKKECRCGASASISPRRGCHRSSRSAANDPRCRDRRGRLARTIGDRLRPYRYIVARYCWAAVPLLRRGDTDVALR